MNSRQETFIPNVFLLERSKYSLSVFIAGIEMIVKGGIGMLGGGYSYCLNFYAKRSIGANPTAKILFLGKYEQ